MDGTLLNSQSVVSTKHIEAVRNAQDAGVIVVIATGRYYMQAERIMKTLDFDGILVSNDGAATIKNKTKEIIHEHSFSVEDISPLITYCRQHEIHFSLTTAFNHYVEFMSPYQIDKCKQYEIQYSTHNDVLELKEPVMKLTIDDEKRINGWQDIVLPSHIKLRANAEFFKEYVHHQTSKTNGLRKVLESYGIDPSEIIAIGDFYNDLDMIEYAGLGVAMGNAPDDVKEKANDVTLSNDEDGVYYALEKHLRW
ncbi:Cof-type HAD-IIB family hydrolase [Paenibacillus sp. MBLB4367]|uniref:Cof-type HAD-IIB family hydrolase n=1 Tax=Paenibacillus sp. MBLB4367 TaxID=3384767 RepID=UPI003908101D